MTTTDEPQLLVSLTDPLSASSAQAVTPARVGGKASSLAKLYAIGGLDKHVPKAFALTIDFFEPWIEELKQTDEFRSLLVAVGDDEAKLYSTKLQYTCRSNNLLSLSEEQSNAIEVLLKEMDSDSWRKPKLAAVRSSAPEEDGAEASFAGAFETKLGVEPSLESLEKAIRDCFASLWDYRVLHYKQQQQQQQQQKKNDDIDFAVVVMEMIDSLIAGVAFTANPLNSDRDELVIDSSYGLGESVVDGTVTADRYIVDKVHSTIVQETLGVKGTEKRLGGREGGVVTKTIETDDPRRTASSLSREQIKELTRLVCLVEEVYCMPMDIEWAFIAKQQPLERSNINIDTDDNNDTNNELELQLLQARPITTLFQLDEKMMTLPGSKRKLYFDINIMSEATTTSPFTTMDMDFYCKATKAIFGMPFDSDWNMLSENSDMLMFNSSTRQYMNMSLALKYCSTEYISEKSVMMDPYVASIFDSKDCDREKYRATRLPKGMGFIDIYRFLKEIPLWQYYKTSRKYSEDPEQAKKEYLKIVQDDLERLRTTANDHHNKIEHNNGLLTEYAQAVFEAVVPSLFEECGLIILLSLASELDEQRRNGATEEIKQEYEALCGGYIGDPLMETNIAMYKLSRTLPESIWKEYDHDTMKQLADRIRQNLLVLQQEDDTKNKKNQEDERDLPLEFLEAWKEFMQEYGYDGVDQLFMSCPRYDDSPELLLSKLRLNALGNVKDPSVTQQEQVEKRRTVMAKHEEDAEKNSSFCFRRSAVSKIRNRNAVLEHLMWIRNAPKIRLAKVIGMIRAEILRIEDRLIAKGCLKEKGDIFHLRLEEVDKAMTLLHKEDNESNNTKDDDGQEGGEQTSSNSMKIIKEETFDSMKIIEPRKAVHERALRATVCPLLVDSRCRILQADPPTFEDGQEPPKGTLIGSAVSPGVATGRVRIVRDPSEAFENGEVLCAVVTGPAWTPMFATASAVVLQIGGVLQHGALCAREYGKPAVSNIDIHNVLKDGMMVSVDGNTGTVKILEETTEEEGVRE